MSGYRMGVDVSQWQGNIDWEKAKAAGIEFAMLRAGFGQNSVDPQFKRNITECNRLGIPCGVYWFSYAYTADMAKREAQCVLKTVEPYRLEYPIAFDFEGDSADYALKKGVTVTRTLVSAFARAFCGEIAAGKYSPMVYTNPDYLSRYYDAEIPKEFDIWLAQWPTKPDLASKPAQAGGIWQYTSSGSVDGITGRVDRNVSYVDYPRRAARKGPEQPGRRRFRGAAPGAAGRKRPCPAPGPWRRASRTAKTPTARRQGSRYGPCSTG